MKKVATTSFALCAFLFACAPSNERKEIKAENEYTNNEVLLQPQAEINRQNEENQKNLYKQQLIDLQAQLILEVAKLKTLTNNEQITEQIKLIDNIKSETEKVKKLVQ